jgi:plastocyanin
MRTQTATSARVLPDGTPLQNRLLAALPTGDYRRILGHLMNAVKTGETLQEEGTRITDVYFPNGGVFSMTNRMRNGALVEVATVGREGMLGIGRVLRRSLEARLFFGDTSGRSRMFTLTGCLPIGQSLGHNGAVLNRQIAVACTFALSLAACGGGGTAPTPSVPSEVTVNVTATGFKPSDAAVAVGGRVTFANIDDRLHSIASLPLTTHSDCPVINEVGVLSPGQSKQTGVFTQAKTCGYHDVFSEGGQLLTGTITVR